MRGDDMILVSVDDHICEPADMFAAHVPEKYRELTPRVVTDDRGSQQRHDRALERQVDLCHRDPRNPAKRLLDAHSTSGAGHAANVQGNAPRG